MSWCSREKTKLSGEKADAISRGKNVTKRIKVEYLSRIEHIIAKRKKKAEGNRVIYCRDILKTPEKYREELKKTLGWPLTEPAPCGLSEVKTEALFQDKELTITRMSFEILEDVWMTGILLEKGDEKRPFILAQHGALGSPEVISGLYGATSNYNDFVGRLLQYDVNIFAPQLLIWNSGYYTMLMSAIDTRIESAVSCFFFCSGNVLREFCDIYFYDIGNKMSWAEMMMLVYPRHICLAVGDEDSGFPYQESEKEFERLEALCETVGTDWVDFMVFHGGHEFFNDDRPLRRMAEYLREKL